MIKLLWCILAVWIAPAILAGVLYAAAVARYRYRRYTARIIVSN